MLRGTRVVIGMLLFFLGGGLFGYPQGSAQVPMPRKAEGDSKKSQSNPMLIEPGELHKALKQDGLRILDTRSRAEYARGHISGALWLDVGRWKTLALKDGGLHDARAWSKEVGQFGIRRDTRVVVYGDSLPSTARIWWLLKYLGVKQVAILNGGWEWWTKKDRPTKTSTPRVTSRPFKPNFQADRLEEIGTLKKSVKTGKVQVVDARSTDEFTGKKIRGKRGGHITGAAHLEWKELLARDGRFKTKDELKALFRKRGILPDETAVCY